MPKVECAFNKAQKRRRNQSRAGIAITAPDTQSARRLTSLEHFGSNDERKRGPPMETLSPKDAPTGCA